MPRLDNATYLDHIRAESARFRAVLAECPPTAGVPSCPEWDAADLLWHLASVQGFWAEVVRTRPAAVDEDFEKKLPRPETYDGLLAAYDGYAAAMIEALATADPADEAWHWSSDHTVGASIRRQAHEALIHRLDAELAAGAVTPLPADLAADGVEEALDVMYGGLPDWGRFEPLPTYVEYRIDDIAQSVWTQIGWFSGTDANGVDHVDEPDQHVVDAPGVAADLMISGTADRLDGWLWHRHDDTGVTVEGDPGVREHVGKVLRQPIN